MRYSPDHKATARIHLLEKTGAVAKRKGFGTTGVDALMAAADMTSGAFYSHFKSKPDLLKAIVEHELSGTAKLFGQDDSTEKLRKALRLYLSEQHVAHPELGCPLPSLSAEVARADEDTRKTFEQLLCRIHDQLQAKMPAGTDAWNALSQMVGAVLLARAMISPEAREAVLDASRQDLDRLLQPVTGPTLNHPVNDA